MASSSNVDTEDLGFDDEEDLEASDLSKAFNGAANALRSITGKLDPATLLYFYARYKQATEGPCAVDRPGGLFNFQGKQKWDAWRALGGMSREEAMSQYVKRLEQIQPELAVARQQPRDSQAQSTSGFGVAISRHLIESDENVGGDDDADLLPDGPIQKMFAAVKLADVNALQDVLAGLTEGEKSLCLMHQDAIGLTVLHHAADRGSLEILRLLMNIDGADVNVRDSEHQTPMHYAASCAHVDVVKFLLEKGAKADALDSDGLTPLMVAENEQIKALLLQT